MNVETKYVNCLYRTCSSFTLPIIAIKPKLVTFYIYLFLDFTYLTTGL